MFSSQAKKAKQAGEKSPVKEKKERQRLKIQEVEDSSEDEETELVTKKAEPKQGGRVIQCLMKQLLSFLFKYRNFRPIWHTGLIGSSTVWGQI